MVQIHEIAPKGDVKLILPAGLFWPSAHIIVSSVALCMGSPVFEAMLGPHFKEGQTLAGGAQLKLPLPGDRIESMLTLCQVIHMKPVTAAPATSEAVLRLAIMVDKYDCRIALSYPISNWIQQPKTRKSDQDRINLLTAAYLVRLHEDFAKLGRDIVLKSSSQTRGTSLYSFSMDKKLQELIDLLNRQRAELVQKGARLLEDIAKEECIGPTRPKKRKAGSAGEACDANCTYRDKRCKGFMEMLLSTRMWPLTSLLGGTLEDACAALRNEPRDWSNAAVPCKGVSGSSCKGSRMRGTRDIISDMKECALNMEQGVIKQCLQCVLNGEFLRKGRCRRGHQGEAVEDSSDSSDSDSEDDE